MTRRRRPRTIAIDGPAASGKTTVGRMLAERYGYLFLDTGLMYRAFALAALRAAIPPTDIDGCARLARRLRLRVGVDGDTRILLGDEDVTDRLREPEVEGSVSAYSAIPAVRAVMVGRQRAVARRRRAVLAGRDIGTVVLPDAPLKLYLDASEETRAERRSRQSATWRTRRDAAGARADIIRRDRTDASRSVAPMRAADDAVRIDTTGLSLDDVLERVRKEVECFGG